MAKNVCCFVPQGACTLKRLYILRDYTPSLQCATPHVSFDRNNTELMQNVLFMWCHGFVIGAGTLKYI